MNAKKTHSNHAGVAAANPAGPSGAARPAAQKARAARGAPVFAVVPAGGVGARVGGQIPKQYLPLVGQRTMLECTTGVLLACAWIERVVVVVAPDDGWHEQALAGLSQRHASRLEVCREGGATRRDSVLAGLNHLTAGGGAADDGAWVMVHDAARPGLDQACLVRLREAIAADPRRSGGLLALPLADTIKQVACSGDEDPDAAPRSVGTLERSRLWAAQTPQMFPLGALRSALQRFENVTDEASAMEQAGVRPLLVAGSALNFKVTTADDLHMMRSLLLAAGHDSSPAPAAPGTPFQGQP